MAGQAEVAELDDQVVRPIAARAQDVLGLQIAVEEAVGVDVDDRGEDGRDDLLGQGLLLVVEERVAIGKYLFVRSKRRHTAAYIYARDWLVLGLFGRSN